MDKVGDHIRDRRLNGLIVPVSTKAAMKESLFMLGLRTLKADPCVDDSIIEEEQAPVPPPDPRAHTIWPWETGQISGCNDFLPPTRDAAANLEKATVRPAPPVTEPSLPDESECLAAKSQKSSNSYIRKSTIMKKSSAQNLKSLTPSKENLNPKNTAGAADRAKPKNGKSNNQDL